jgi:hypothetical protein
VPTAAETLYDQRALQILSTEHWGLLSARALAYNESFTRAGMFLTFLSMSFVALALLAQGIGFGGDFIVIAALALGFNLLVGLFTLSRIITTWIIDGHATQGMNRIRNGYTQIAPAVGPFFITGTHDDEAGVNVTYGIQDRTSKLTGLTYGLSTTLGMVGVIVALLAGLLGGLIAIGAGVSLLVAGGAGAITAGLVFLAELVWAGRVLLTAALPPRFPTPDAEATLRR